MQSNWPILKGEYAFKAGFWSLLLFVIILPFQPVFPPVTSGIVAFWLVYVLSFRKDRLLLIPKNKMALVFLLYYLVLIVGLLYTSNRPEAGRDIVLKISMLLWPLGMASWPELILRYRNKILIAFATATAASAAIVMGTGIYKWLQSGASADQLYTFMNVLPWVPNHYIALYSSFSVIVLLWHVIKIKRMPVLPVAGIALLMTLLAMVSVRIQFIALPAAILAFIFVVQRRYPSKNIFWITGSAIILIVALFLILPSSRNRLNETVDEWQSAQGKISDKQTNHRVYLWSHGWKVIQKNMLLGIGTGGADDALNASLKSCDAQYWDGQKLVYLNEKNYNYHNAFLQHWATHGIFGLLLLIAFFVAPLYIFKGQINGIQAAFLVLCFISFLTESMLERQAGVLFFAFISSLLFVPLPNQEQAIATEAEK